MRKNEFEQGRKSNDYRGFTEGAKNADDAISERGHNPGSMVRSDGGTVFMKGDITNIMEAVFNTPKGNAR